MEIDFLNRTPQSFWLDSIEGLNTPKLDRDLDVDVAIVGGGMVGITTAWMLKNKGLNVALVESDKLFRGTTGYTTAKITSQHGLIYDKLVNKMGKDVAKQYADANEMAKETIHKIIEENNIQCDFSRQNAYIYTQADEYIEQIETEAKTAASLGIKANVIRELPIPVPVKSALVFENQAQFHPTKYLMALAKEINSKNQCIYENTQALDIEDNTVITTGGKIKAKYIVIASHFPFYDGLGMYFTRLYPERSYIVAVKLKEDFPGGMYINAESPTRSLRYQDTGEDRLVLVGGENHKTGQSKDTVKHYESLLAFARDTFLVDKVVYHWSTQDLLTPDDIPYIGRLTGKHPNIFVATGFKKWGMTTSTAAATTISDLIIKGQSELEELYNPSRKDIKASASTFIKENLNVASHLFTGKLSTLSNQAEEVKGNVTTFEGGGQKIGSYKDDDGNLHLVDTTCTHMGCELQWNNGEKSWDCPCHGSRFSYKGEVIEGPAQKNLSYKMQKEPKS